MFCVVVGAVCFLIGNDDGLNFFHCDENFVELDPDVSTSLTIQFVPLKLIARHCSVVLSNSDFGDFTLSICASVNQPFPTLPEIIHPNPSTVINMESRTLHLNTTTNSVVKENIVIRNSNVSLEKALLEISKWGLCGDQLKNELLAESLDYAALACGVSKLHIGNCLNVSSNKFEEAVVFTVNGNDNKHFIFPEQVNVPTSITGNILWSCFNYRAYSMFFCVQWTFSNLNLCNPNLQSEHPF